MSKTVSKFALAASIVLAMAFTFSCTSDIESAEDVLKKAESSSSDVRLSSAGSSSSVSSLSSVGGSSSAVQGVSSGGSSQSVSVLCDFGDGDCREFPVDACLVFGQIVASCPVIAVSSSSLATPSSGSPVPSSGSVEPPISSSISIAPSSSSSLPSGTVLCVLSGTCTAISAEVCATIGGLAVQSCLASSSSSGTPAVPSSSSIGGGNSSSGGGSSSSGAPLSGNSFTDSRDGKIYKKVTIGSQTWMGENLNYNASGSKCYDNLNSNCETYGRLYNWETANKAACPSGWHLPTKAEWDVLGDDAKNLKATSFGGTNGYGFSALPGGSGYFSYGSFSNVGGYGYWWSANGYRYMSYGSDHAGWGNTYDASSLFSVRCLQN